MSPCLDQVIKNKDSPSAAEKKMKIIHLFFFVMFKVKGDITGDIIYPNNSYVWYIYVYLPRFTIENQPIMWVNKNLT